MLVVPGSAAGPRRGRGRGPGQGLHRRRRRVAVRRLLHVPGHEPGHAQARPALRLHVQPQLRGPAGPGRAHPPGLAAGRRRHRRRRPAGRPRRPARRSSQTMEKFTVHTGIAVPLRRSNVDTDQIIPAVYLKRVTRTGFEDGLFNAWRDDPAFVLNDPAYAGRLDPRRRARVRHRLVARARRVGAAGLRVPGRHRAVVRRHLPRQRPQGGLLPVVLPEKPSRSCGSCSRSGPDVELTVDLVGRRCVAPDHELGLSARRAQPVAPDGGPRRHRTDPAARGRDRRLRGHAPVLEAGRRPDRSSVHIGYRRSADRSDPCDTTIFCRQIFVSWLRRDYCARRMAVVKDSNAYGRETREQGRAHRGARRDAWATGSRRPRRSTRCSLRSRTP